MDQAVKAARHLTLVLAVLSGACVSKANYDRSVADAAKAKAAADDKARADAALILDLQGRITAAESATQDRDARLSDLSTSTHNLQAQLDEATAINQQLRGELSRLGKDVDKILADRGTLSKALDDARARLEELRKAQAAAEVRTILFRDYERRFKPLIDAGQLRVESRRGRLAMEVSADLLFDAGRADLKTTGKGALMEIARALQTTSAPGRRFLVTAAVDAEPLKSRRYKDTWELTTARAVTVVEYLVSLGVSPETLTAAGAGSFDPVAPSDSPDARAKNRRVEIALLPSAEETLPVGPEASR
jgi:chemotaxis protein MotB